MQTRTFHVIGMTCGHCEAAVAAQLRKLPGVRDVQIDVAAGTAVVTSEHPLAVAGVARAVDEAGYELA